MTYGLVQMIKQIGVRVGSGASLRATGTGDRVGVAGGAETSFILQTEKRPTSGRETCI